MSAATRCPWRVCWKLVRNTGFRPRPACALPTPWTLPAQSWAAQLLQDSTWVEETIAKTKLCDWFKAQATTRAATSASSTIDAVERLTRLKEGMAESRVLLLPDAFERFKVICTVIQELYIYCTALVQQRWASMPEQADAAHAADSEEAHTDIHRAPNVSHTGEEAKADDSPVVQCGEGPCDAGGSAASACSGTGEVMQSTAVDLYPFKTYIVMMPDNLRPHPMGRSFRGGASSDLEVLHEGSTADEWPRWYGTEMADLHGSNGTIVRLNFSIILRHATSLVRINEGAVRGLIAQLPPGCKRATLTRMQQRSDREATGTVTAKHCHHLSGQPRLLVMRRTLEFVKRLRRERATLAQTQQP